MYKYKTDFNLTASVNNFDAAYNYLNSANMTKYLKEDTRIHQSIRDSVEHIMWVLTSECSGYIELITNSILSAIDLKSISNFVSGQNSDGLGEGFEQQDFANYYDTGLSGFDNDDWDDEYIMASFDWKNNSYIFELISNE